MSDKTNDVLKKYLELNKLDTKLYTEQTPGGPAPGIEPMDAPPAVPPTPVEPEVKTMSDEAFVSAVKTMIELLSYGINAPESVLHRDPVADLIKMKNDITQENAYDILEKLEELLATDSPTVETD